MPLSVLSPVLHVLRCDADSGIQTSCLLLASGAVAAGSREVVSPRTASTVTDLTINASVTCCCKRTDIAVIVFTDDSRSLLSDGYSRVEKVV